MSATAVRTSGASIGTAASPQKGERNNKMAEEPTTETRLAALERKFAALERDRQRERQLQDERDIALLARIDSFLEDLRRMDRSQLRMFEVQLAELRMQGMHIETLGQDVGSLAEIARNHKDSIEQVGQEVRDLADPVGQILALLTGQQKQND